LKKSETKLKIPFVKYQGTGNDFILIDARNGVPTLDVAFWCHRKFGIGADGLMFLAPSQDADFEMIYYNSDGQTSTMCGNGGRCIAHWAHRLGFTQNNLRFKAADGYHIAEISGNSVKLSMNDVSHVQSLSEEIRVLNTGSPHYVKKVEQMPSHFVEEARNIRQSEPFKAEGINVNFYRIKEQGSLICRTFERGVEDETLSCGTGVTAVALSYAQSQGLPVGSIYVETEGGPLIVHFQQKEKDSFSNIFLEGPVAYVFDGTLDITPH